jgi:hypothetical protein
VLKEEFMLNIIKNHARILLVLLAATTLSGGFVSAEDAPKADAPKEWAVAPLLPPDTLAVITTPDARKLTDKFKQLGVWQIFNDPDIQKAFRNPLTQFQTQKAVAEMALGMKVPEFLSMFNQGEVTFALLSVDHVGDNGNPIPDLLLSIQARDKTQAVIDELTKRIDQVNTQVGNVLEITQTPMGNYTLHRVGVPGQQLGLNYTVCEGDVIVVLGDGRLERLLALHEKTKGGPLKADAQPEALCQTVNYSKAVEKAGGESDLMLHVNFEELRKTGMLNVKPHNDQDARVWATLGLESIRSFSYNVSLRGKAIREMFFIDSPAAARKGLLTVLDGAVQLDPTALNLAPKESLGAIALKADPEKLLEKLADIGSLENPNAKDQLQQGLAQLGQTLNVDVKKHLFNALTGQMVFSVAAANKTAKIGIGFPDMLLTLPMKDAEAVKTTLAAIRKAAEEKFEFTEIAQGDKTIINAREKFPVNKEPGQLSFVVDKNDLILSLNPLALRKELRRRENAGSPGAKSVSLVDDADFKAASTALAGTPQFLMYADTASIAGAAYDFALSVAQIKQKDPNVDLTALPAGDALTQHLVPSAFSVGADADGVVVSGYSPLSIIGIFALGITDGVAKGKFGKQADAGERMDNQAPAPTHGVLDTIKTDLKSYADQNGGNYPATLKEMQPKLLANLTTELDNVVFLGKQDRANKIVAHTSEKLPGPIGILLQDGTVTEIPRNLLGKTLKEGYTANVRPAITNGQGTVKPPTPPTDF